MHDPSPKLLRHLGTARDPGRLAEQLDACRAADDDAGQERLYDGLDERLRTCPEALAQWARLISQQHAAAIELTSEALNHLHREHGEGRQQLLVRALAAAPAPGLVAGPVQAMGSSAADGFTKHCASHLLEVLAGASPDLARDAARAGAFGQLARRIKGRPRAPSAGDIHDLERALLAVRHLARRSANRAQLAARQGVLEALAPLLEPGEPPGIQRAAAFTLSTLLESLPRQPGGPVQPRQLQRVAGGLAGLLARGPGSRKAEWAVVIALSGLQRGDVAGVGAAVAARPGAVASLARIAGAIAQQAAQQDLGNLPDMALSLLLDAVGAGDFRHLEAACEAGLLPALEQLLQPQVDAVSRAIASTMVPVFRGLLSTLVSAGVSHSCTVSAGVVLLSRYLAGEGAEGCRLLGAGVLLRGLQRAGFPAAWRWREQLDELAQRCGAMRPEECSAAVGRAAAGAASAAAACAACGARQGEPGVKLMACSRCGKARYCGAACQRRHWREHKARCAGVVVRP
jgi:hypothetical protein